MLCNFRKELYYSSDSHAEVIFMGKNYKLNGQNFCCEKKLGNGISLGRKRGRLYTVHLKYSSTYE